MIGYWKGQLAVFSPGSGALNYILNSCSCWQIVLPCISSSASVCLKAHKQVAKCTFNSITTTFGYSICSEATFQLTGDSSAAAACFLPDRRVEGWRGGVVPSSKERRERGKREMRLVTLKYQISRTEHLVILTFHDQADPDKITDDNEVIKKADVSASKSE